jgi:predicted aspartyl protease
VPPDCDLDSHSLRHIRGPVTTSTSGYLTLPSSAIDELQLRTVGARLVTLGDGSTTVLYIFRARVRWHEGERGVLVLQSDGVPLLGMALLYGSRVILDVVDNGNVVVDSLA